MICRNCGTEIADKAIVCYRCGTATTDPVRRPAPLPRRGGTLFPLVGMVALILAGLYLGRAGRVSPAHGTAFESAAAVCIVLAIAVLVFRLRRR